MTVRKQILLTLLFFTLLPLIIGGTISYYTINSDLSLIEQEQAIFTGKTSVSSFEFLGEQIKQAAKSYGFWDETHDAIASKRTDWIKEEIIDTAKSDYNLDFGAISDTSGKVIATFGPVDFGSDLKAHPLIKRLVSGEKIAQGVYESPQGIALVGISQVLKNEGEGETAGYLVYGKFINKEHLEKVKRLTGADISLFSKTGGTKVFTNELFSTPPAESQSVLKRKELENTYLTALQPLMDINGNEIASVTATVPIIASVKAQNNLKNVYATVLIISLILAVGIGLLMAKRFVRPLLSISALLEEIGQGNLRQDEQKESRGELGKMIQAYNQMISGLRRLINGTNENADQVAHSSGVLIENIGAFAKATAEINQGVKEVAAASQKGLDSSLRSSRVIEQMVKDVQGIAVDSKTVLQISREAENASQKISQIVEVITGIAVQTNLLALNAAIEAARAGEQGRGFAVVADEVRKLAEESAKSASEIQNIILNILEDTDKAVKSMREEIEVINQGAFQVEKSGGIFKNIQQDTSKVADKIKGIVERTENLAKQSDQVMEQVVAVENNAHTSFDSARAITTTAEEQIAAVKNLVTSIGLLDSMAKNLRELTHKFKT